MEFIISTDLGNSLPEVIDFNFNELKQFLSESLAYYNALVITPEGIKGGKEDRAKLNKLKAAVDDRRKEVKRMCLAPYEEFELKCKTLSGMIDAASSSIDKQIKAFEDAEKKEKRDRIESEFNALAGDMASYIKFQQVFNPRWLNASYKESDATLEIEAEIDRCRKDISAIRGLESDFETELLDQYAQGNNLSSVIARAASLKARKEEEARRRSTTSTDVIQATPETHVSFSNALDNEPEVATQLDFRIWATKTQRNALKAFLISNNIKYGKVD